MKKGKVIILGMLALALVFGFVFASCDNGYLDPASDKAKAGPSTLDNASYTGITGGGSSSEEDKSGGGDTNITLTTEEEAFWTMCKGLYTAAQLTGTTEELLWADEDIDIDPSKWTKAEVQKAYKAYTEFMNS
jgi:hypothetical protein